MFNGIRLVKHRNPGDVLRCGNNVTSVLRALARVELDAVKRLGAEKRGLVTDEELRGLAGFSASGGGKARAPSRI